MKKCVLNDERFLSEYFDPHYGSFAEPFWVRSEGCKLACYRLEKDPRAKTIVFFHGNGETVSDFVPEFAPRVSALGYNCFLAEYRGYGMSTGEPGFPELLEDVKAVLDVVCARPERVVLYGRSLGSLAAIHGICLFPNIAGLILESGIAELQDWGAFQFAREIPGIPEEELADCIQRLFNNEEKLKGFRGATLVLHCQRDHVVPVENGHTLYQWAPEPKAITLFDRGDHNTIMHANEAEYWRVIRCFMNHL